MKLFYQSLKAMLSAKLPEVNHINKWNDQLLNLEDETPFDRPAIFIEIEPIQWENTTKKTKKGAVSIILHIVTDCYNTFEDDVETLEALDLMDKTTGVMEANKISYCTPFINTTTMPDNNHGNLIENKVIFTTEYTKCVSVGKIYTEVTPDLEVTGAIE